jgi:predicted kinase
MIMEIIVLVGIPGSGKSTLALTRFPQHKRISLDVVHSRNKEDEEIASGLKDGRDIVIDNTSTTVKSRKKYVELAKLYGANVRAIYLKCPIDIALQRNASRVGKERIPDDALRFYDKILQPPTIEEGFNSVEEIIAK